MELWDVYDNNRNLLHKTRVRGEKLLTGENHMVVEVWTINEQHQLLLTKRHPNKNFGNLWECTGGAAIAGEDSKTAVMRELREETGLIANVCELSLMGTDFLEERHCFLDTYVYHTNKPIEELSWQESEVIDGKYVSLEEFDKMQENGEIAPPVWYRFEQYREQLMKEILVGNETY